MLNTEWQRLSIEWAKDIVSRPWVVLHVSATGNNPRDVILRVVVLDSEGSKFYDSMICPPQNKPVKKEWLEEMAVTKEALKVAPDYQIVREELKAACKNKSVLVCNGNISRIFQQTADRHSGKQLRMKMEDVYRYYSSFKGQDHLYGEFEGSLEMRPMKEEEILSVCKKLISMTNEMAVAVPPPPMPKEYRSEPEITHYIIDVTSPASTKLSVQHTASPRPAKKQRVKKLTKKESKFMVSAFFILIVLILGKCSQ